MAICSICGKTKVIGNNVSHSQRHSKRYFRPNLQKVNRVMVCTRCLRTSAKEKK